MDHKPRPSAASAFLACYLAYSSIYISRVNLSVAGPALMADHLLNAAQIGALGTVFSVVYACSRLINGALSDRAHPWVMICLGLLACGLANVCSGLFPPFAVMAVLWGVNAYGQSMLWGSVLRTVSAVYPPEIARRRCALAVTTTAVGTLAGILLCTWLIGACGVRYAYYVPGGLNILLGAVCVLVLHPLPFQGRKSAGGAARALGLMGSKNVRSMLLPALLHGVIKDNITLWVTVYFVSFFGIDLQQSYGFVLLVPLVALGGRLLYQPVFSLCGKKENTVSVLAFLLCAAVALSLFFNRSVPWLAAAGMALVYAAVSLVNTSLLSIYPLHFPRDMAGVSGAMDFVTYIGAGIGSAGYGAVIQRLGSAGFGIMFLSWAVISLVSAAVLHVLSRRQSGGQSAAIQRLEGS